MGEYFDRVALNYERLELPAPHCMLRLLLQHCRTVDNLNTLYEPFLRDVNIEENVPLNSTCFGNWRIDSGTRTSRVFWMRVREAWFASSGKVA